MYLIYLHAGTAIGDIEEPELTIDMKETNEPATATNPRNWRVIEELFPYTNGKMDVIGCACDFNLGNK